MFRFIQICLSAIFLLHSAFISADIQTLIQPPQAKKISEKLIFHNDVRFDDYYWMKNIDDPEVIEYLLAWNAYSHNVMQETEKLQFTLNQEMIAQVDEEYNSFHLPYGDHDYFMRHTKNQDHPVLYRKKNHPKQTEELLFDPNVMAVGLKYFKMQNWVPSPNGLYVAYAIDLIGTDYCTIFIQNTLTKEIFSEEKIPCAFKTLIWNDDSKGFWYITPNATFRDNKVMFHQIGSDPAFDRLIYEETDSDFILNIKESNDKRFIFINSLSTTSSGSFYLGKKDPTFQVHLIAPKIVDRQCFPESFGDQFFIRVKNGPHNCCIMTALFSDCSKWTSYIPSSETVQIFDLHVFKNHLVLSKLEKGLIKFEVRDLITNEITQVPLPDIFYNAFVIECQDFSKQVLKIDYSSPITQESVFAFDMDTKRLSLLKQRKVAYNPSLYTLERVEALAQDGTSVPISLCYRKDALRNGPAPLRLYGYGAYEQFTDDDYNGPDYCLLDRGVICAVAHIRGGGECGRTWYEQGRHLNKQNTFTDFICCAEELIKKGYTSNSKLVIEGRSAGGLLVGGVINMRPDLFKAAVAEVPFVDVLTTMGDVSIPYVELEYGEWGNSNIEGDYFYMKGYSPYDNIERKAYPSLLITAGLYDAQVQYWEAAKWAAKLLEYKTDDNPLLFKVNMTAGHQSYSNRSLQFKDVTFKYAFILQQLGINE